ncbi:MAG: phosphatidate cytidylyltransferase [Candidatus Sumerlaeota bacterium]|nr:phosphatidate cytidylyltransferase [Candidatus Sumerlaeota bacterium]
MTSTRIISFVIFTPVFLAGIYWQPLSFILPIVIGAVVLMSAYEFCRLANSAGYKPELWVVAPLALVLGLSPWLAPSHAAAIHAHLLTDAVIGGLMVAGAVMLLRNQAEHALANISMTLFGGIYAGMPIGLAMALYRYAPTRMEGGFILIFLIGITWWSDSGAYFAGRRFGRVKLCPKISPNKTMEGLAGGIVAAIAYGVLLRLAPIPGREVFSWMETFILILLCCVFAPVGDLVESLIKRDAKVKDSGRDYTGHGGMLDIIDSLLFTLPMAYIYLVAIHPAWFLRPCGF